MVVVVAAAVALRIYVLDSPIGRLDGDEGVTAVMAQKILGGSFPVFFGQQNYQGALEQYLQAGVLAVLPDSPLTLRLVQVALMAVAIGLAYVIAAQVTRSRWAGVLAAALLAVGPYYFIYKGIKSHGGYDSAMVGALAMAAIAFALARSGRRPWWAWLLAGLAGGLAMWGNPTALYVVAPVALWLLAVARGSLVRSLGALAAGAVIGLLPAIVSNLVGGEISPFRTSAQPATSFGERLGNLFDPVLGDFLGVHNADPALDPGMPARAVVVMAIVALIAGLWHRRRGLWDLLRLRRSRAEPIDVILLALAIAPIIYAASPFTWYVGEPRYLFTLYPFAVIAAVAGIWAIRPREFRMAAAVTALIGLAFITSSTIAAAVERGGALVTIRLGAIYSEDLPQVARRLADEGASAAYAPFWMAGPLQFATGNQVAVASGLWTQFPDQERQVRATRDAAVVVPTDPGAGQVRTALERSGRTFREHAAGRFTVFTRIAPPWRPGPGSFVLYAG